MNDTQCLPGPTKPAGVGDGNWIQTTPGKGWNTLLRLYSPLEPFFTKLGVSHIYQSRHGKATAVSTTERAQP